MITVIGIIIDVLDQAGDNRMAIVEAPEPQFGSEWRLPGMQQIEAEIEGWG